jgi:hypothetical protein
MGYYTTYELSTKGNKYKVSDIVSYMSKKYHSDSYSYYAFQYEFKDNIKDESTSDFELYGEQCKWYEHDEEMIELSLRFPETVFCLYGEGEESGDIWYTYYKNGKTQYCPAKIVFDEYDESKLR